MQNNTGILLGKADKIIIKLLKKSERALSTYEIAKMLNFSWATANTHCYKLMSLGEISGRNEELKIGMRRIVWVLVDRIENKGNRSEGGVE
ncbi:MAG: hypothetical protein KAJ20_04565 [Candidatus Aenigmarchaeota archaeon]|nr:hypothetical protein [Candidatus Aenigmarchaeota archaeon]